MNDLTERIILGILRDHDGSPMTAQQLFVPVNGESPTAVTRNDLSARLAALEKKEQIFSAATDDGVRYTITVRGKARLAEAGL